MISDRFNNSYEDQFSLLDTLVGAMFYLKWPGDKGEKHSIFPDHIRQNELSERYASSFPSRDAAIDALRSDILRAAFSVLHVCARQSKIAGDAIDSMLGDFADLYAGKRMKVSWKLVERDA